MNLEAKLRQGEEANHCSSLPSLCPEGHVASFAQATGARLQRVVHLRCNFRSLLCHEVSKLSDQLRCFRSDTDQIVKTVEQSKPFNPSIMLIHMLMHCRHLVQCVYCANYSNAQRRAKLKSSGPGQVFPAPVTVLLVAREESTTSRNFHAATCCPGKPQHGSIETYHDLPQRKICPSH